MSSRIRRVVLGLGANLGNRLGAIRSGASALRALPGVLEAHGSALYETTPVGGPAQDDYINGAVLLMTELTGRQLLEAALEIERRHGRVRLERFGPRTLDIDVLWIEHEVLDEPQLVVPHPRLHERAFALVPLLDVAPEAVDPRSGRPFAEQLAEIGRQGVRPTGLRLWQRRAESLAARVSSRWVE